MNEGKVARLKQWFQVKFEPQRNECKVSEQEFDQMCLWWTRNFCLLCGSSAGDVNHEGCTNRHDRDMARRRVFMRAKKELNIVRSNQLDTANAGAAVAEVATATSSSKKSVVPQPPPPPPAVTRSTATAISQDEIDQVLEWFNNSKCLHCGTNHKPNPCTTASRRTHAIVKASGLLQQRKQPVVDSVTELLELKAQLVKAEVEKERALIELSQLQQAIDREMEQQVRIQVELAKSKNRTQETQTRMNQLVEVIRSFDSISQELEELKQSLTLLPTATDTTTSQCCTICRERKKNWVLVPCGHVFCETCVIQLKQKQRGKKKCPECKLEFQANCKIVLV